MEGKNSNFKDWKLMNKDIHESFSQVDQSLNLNKEIEYNVTLSKEYAQIGVKYLLIISSGALISLPTLTGVFGYDNTDAIQSAAVFFTLALFFVIITIFTAYISCCKITSHSVLERNMQYGRAIINHQKHSGLDYKEDIIQRESDLSEYPSVMAGVLKWAQIWDNVAFITAALSAIAFLLGCWSLIMPFSIF